MAKFNIVVYGCDNSGKTTLCQQLVNYLIDNGIDDVEYVKSLGPVGVNKQVDFLHEKINDYSKEFMIFDRLPIIEEEVCGNVLRGSNNFDHFQDYVSKVLGRITLFIHCDPVKEAIEKWGTREQMAGIKENAKALANGYAAYSTIHCTDNRTIKYNYNQDNWEDIALLSILFRKAGHK